MSEAASRLDRICSGESSESVYGKLRAMTFAEAMAELAKEAEQYDTCMSVFVNEEAHAVTLLLDTGVRTYGEWIPGEGSDICLYRCMDTNRVAGVRLPLLKSNLAVHHTGPLRINDGFKKQ